ncbi:monomeric sarcosine oxidase-like [Ptychodera flava]|uniref:monomeric sarcosine oxidase-like n=1 Tax=Ptychodera flava TaxID=63121 RepID=UPI003969FCE4
MAYRNVVCTHYDLCIVGAGLIGSAAARHATLTAPHLKVCLIGPKEPKDRRQCKHGIFSAHYDEGRLVRLFGQDQIWAELTKRSIERYHEIEMRSGVKFFSEVGSLSVVTKNDEVKQQEIENAKAMNIPIQILDKNEVTEKFSFLSIQDDSEAVFQLKGSGHVSARLKIIAQQTAAQQQGCQVIDDVIDQVTETTQSDASKCLKVVTSKGKIIFAKKVLLATGAFTGFRDLLPPGKVLDTTLLTQTVVYAEISDKDAERLQDMPSGCLDYTKGELSGCYLLPPIKYPDGKYYLKVGHRKEYERELRTPEEVSDWYKTEGDKNAFKPLLDCLFQFVRGVTPVSTHGDCCVTTHTPTNHPYCDMITPLLGITVGGNGHAAKAADEIGRMGARMIIAGQWDHDLPKERFKAKFKPDKKVLVSRL